MFLLLKKKKKKSILYEFDIFNVNLAVDIPKGILRLFRFKHIWLLQELPTYVIFVITILKKSDSVCKIKYQPVIGEMGYDHLQYYTKMLSKFQNSLRKWTFSPIHWK